MLKSTKGKRGSPDAEFMLSSDDEEKIVGGVNSSTFDYIEAGIKLFSQDNGPTEFFYCGRQISKAHADAILNFYTAHGRRPAQSEMPLY